MPTDAEILAGQLEKISGQLQGLETIKDILAKFVIGQRYSSLPTEALIAKVIKEVNEPYKTIEYNASVAQTGLGVAKDIAGGVFQIVQVLDAGGALDPNAYIDVRFNSPQNSPIRFRLGYRVVTPFNRVWISNPAQAGVVFTMAAGLEFDNIFQFDFPISGALTTVGTINHITNITEVPATGTIVSVRSIHSASPTVLYTVPVGQILYISTASIAGFGANSPAQFNFGSLEIVTAGDVFVQAFCGYADYGNANGYWPAGGSPLCMIPQIAVPAGYKVRSRLLDSAGLDDTGDRQALFSGWLI